MGTRYRALAAPVDVSTGDQRRFAADQITADELPMPLRSAREDIGAHDGAVVVGKIDGLEITPDEIWVEYEMFDDIDPARMPRLAEDVAEAMTLMDAGVVGLSVDLDDYEAAIVKEGTSEPVTPEMMDDPDAAVEMLITKGRIRSATLVAIPAFAETKGSIQRLGSVEDDEAVSEPDDEPDANPELALVAAVSGDTSLPVADRGLAWDGPGAAKRVFDAYSDASGKVDKSRAGRAFLWVDGDGSERGQYKLPFADLVDGKLTIIPRGVAATAGGRGVDSTDGVDKKALKSRICALYAKIRKTYDDWPECPFEGSKAAAEGMASLAAAAEHEALTASTGALFSVDAFTPPVEINRLTRITYDWELGIAYGHVAPWDLCHEGIAGSCVLAPKDSDGAYRQFHAHRVETDEGTIYAGRITVGGRHPETHDGITAHHVRHHHDEMTTVAYVRATEDEFGIFVCGPIVPGVDEETKQILSRRKVSADWRETVDGLSMIEVLALGPGPKAVSEPGFPVLAGFAAGRQIALVASLMPAPTIEVAAGQVITADMVRALDMGEAFKVAYHTIKAEEAAEAERTAQATQLRVELAEVMSADAARVRDALAQAIGV